MIAFDEAQQGDEPLIIGYAFGMELERPDNLGAIR